MDQFVEPITFDDDFDIDFSEISNELEQINFHKHELTLEYDMATKEKYRVMRKIKLDPIAYHEISDEFAFKFPYKWDPYTGERTVVDPDGPLFFDPDILIKHFHTKRLDKLWGGPIDDVQTGYFSGYYDDAVGIGNEFNCIGRGLRPEWYLFRLPIIDCYLTVDHNKQFITLGPKLTDEEIDNIDKLAKLRPDNYIKLFGCHRPSLKLIKQLYDNAISKAPSISLQGFGKNIVLGTEYNENQMTVESYGHLNRKYVEMLKKIVG